MTEEEHKQKIAFLESVLEDAIERGDYHLEVITLEMLNKLKSNNE